MKRILALCLSAALLLALLCACTGGDPETTVTPPDSAGESASDPLADPTQEPSLDLSSEEPTEEVSEEPSAEPSEEPDPTPDPTATPAPTQAPTHHPEESHHVDPTRHPEESHHVDPTHHPEPTSTPAPTPEPTPTPAAGVDLHGFYRSILAGDEEFKATEALFGEILENFYPGLSAIALKQQEIYAPMMSGAVCEIALVEVENPSDVSAVKAIFQARIDTQAGGGAWYPDSVAGWKNDSRIVAHGNYVMMIAYRNCDSVVSQFNALF